MREGNQGECVVKFLQDMGFEDINAHTYDKKSTKDSIALAIARKKVDDLTVISLVVCGNNYGEKWASNVSIGNGTIPEGFSEAAGKALQELDAYLNRYPPEGKAKIWITGYSRGGAVADIVAARCTDSGRFQDVYAYSFVNDEIFDSYINWWEKYGLAMKRDELLFANGVMPSITSIIRAFTDVGDNVLIQTPVYHVFFYVIEDNDRNVVENPLIYDSDSNDVETAYAIDFDDLEEKFKDPKTKLMIAEIPITQLKITNGRSPTLNSNLMKDCICEEW